jgi:hypothetical protein
MTCNKIDIVSSQYIDGELNENIEKELFEHIEECEKCRQIFEFYKDYKKNLTHLSIGVDSFNDNASDRVWVNISGKINYFIPEHNQILKKKKQFNIIIKYTGIAAVFFVLIFGMIIFKSFKDNHQNDIAKTLIELEKSSKEYQKARDRLIQNIKKNNTNIDPETIRTIENNFQIIDEAINEIKITMRTNKDDKELLNQLAFLYQNEVYMVNMTGKFMQIKESE